MSRLEDCELKFLLDAVDAQNLDLMESLLKRGTYPNAVDINFDWTALHFICSEHKLTKIHLKMIQFLIQYGADVNIQDEDGNSPMMILFTTVNKYNESNDMGLRIEALELPLKNGADVTLVNNDSETIFRNIILCNPANPDTAVALELLLKNGANPNMVDSEGMTALNFLCNQPCFTRVHLKMIQILIQYNADVNIQDQGGHSPIMNLFRRAKKLQITLRSFQVIT